MTHRTKGITILILIVVLEQKDTNQNQSKEETHKARSERILCLILLALQCVSPAREPTQIWRAGVFIGVLLKSVTDWIIWPSNWTSMPLLSLEVWLTCGSKPQPFNHKIGLSSVASSHPEITWGKTLSHFISITQVWFKGFTMKNTDPSTT